MLQRQFDEEDHLLAMDMEHAKLLAAAEQQRGFDEEDYLLAMDMEHAEILAASEQQRVFDCGVCLETLPEESIARFDPCGHSFCRECVRGLIVSQIESRRFPVLCPTCTAEPENNRPERIGSYVSFVHYSRQAS
jgi:Ring finger domain